MPSQTFKEYVPDPTLTFEKVWAAIQESAQKADKERQELERLIKENSQAIERTDKQIGDLGNRFGELAEHLVAPNIREKFNELGFCFTRSALDVEIRDSPTSKTLAEVDILLENGDTVMAVEVKSKPKQSDVDDHAKRMEVLRTTNKNPGIQKFCGAIAGAIMSESVREYALKEGFYVIEQTGDTVKINIPQDFVPREW